ncbi:MAG: NRDE family protein, partial [Pseudomonadota bacterium]
THAARARPGAARSRLRWICPVCLIAFAWRMRVDAPLLLVANRDEFHARPAAAAGFWDDAPGVFAGRDMTAGGTWIGLGKNGRFAAVTNIRDPQGKAGTAARSRGELTADFLRLGTPAESYLGEIAQRIGDYQGFNLLIGDGQALWYLHGESGSTPRALTPGVYGLSNAALDVPWPKLVLARERLAQLALAPPLPSAEDLNRCVSSRQLALEEELAEFGDSMLPALSAQFIVTPVYGTRCQTTLRYLEDGHRELCETRFDETGVAVGTSGICMVDGPGPG